MPIFYGTESLRPTPQVELSHGFQTLGDGRLVGRTITATLNGTIVTDKFEDTDTPHVIEQKLSTVIDKQKAIRKVFAENGKWLEVVGLDGVSRVKFIAQVTGVDFAAGPWVERCDYTVTLTGEAPAGEEGVDQNHIESASESWQFEEGDGPHTYRVSHTLSAKGKTYYDTNGANNVKAWEYARNFVTDKLRLGWSTINVDWSPKSGNDIFLSGNMSNEGGILAYNRVVTENVEEADGNYNATESFFLSRNPYWEEYTVSVRKDTEKPMVTTTLSVSGTIHGLTSNMHDPEGKTANAIARFADVKTLVYSRVSSYVPGVTLNIKPTSQSYDINTTEGTVSYQYEFDDRVLENHTFEWYNVSQEVNIEDSKTTVKIDGVITGVRYPDDVYNPLLAYQRAAAQFEIIKSRMLARCKTDSGILDLKAFPITASVSPDKQSGTINYSFSFDNRIPESVRDEYTISTSFSKTDGMTTVNVSGGITGLRTGSATWPFVSNTPQERYNNAKAYFAAIQDNIIGLASQYVDVTKVNPNPVSRRVAHIANAGQITYEYEYNSVPKPCTPGVLAETITFTDDEATPVIAIIPILGRKRGPIIQNIGTVKERRRSVAIELVFPVDVSADLCSTVGPPASVDITKYAPKGSDVYIEQDQSQWSPNTGRYTRTVSWIYVV